MKIIGAREISGNKYFKILLEENYYTAETFTSTYNRLYPDSPIAISTVNSWSSGRRSFKNAAALTVQHIAHVLDDANASESEFERYAGIAYHLVNGIRICIYENQKGNEPEEEAN